MSKLLRDNAVPLTLGGLSLLLSWWLYGEQSPTQATSPPPTAVASSPMRDAQRSPRTVTTDPSGRSVPDQAELDAAQSPPAQAASSKTGPASSSPQIPRQKKVAQPGSPSLQQQLLDFPVSPTDWRPTPDPR